MMLQVEEQQRSSKAAKARLSANWSDKEGAYRLDTYSSGLRTADPTALFHEGATRFPDRSVSVTELSETSRILFAHAPGPPSPPNPSCPDRCGNGHCSGSRFL